MRTSLASATVVKARTIRRQIKLDKYNKQMMDAINASPVKMTTTAPPSTVVMPQAAMKKQKAPSNNMHKDTDTTAASSHWATTTNDARTHRLADGNSTINAAGNSTASNTGTLRERSFR